MARKLTIKAAKAARSGEAVPASLGGDPSSLDSAWHLAEPRIGFLLVPRFSMLELFCAIEPLRIANRLGGLAFSWSFISADGAPVAALALSKAASSLAPVAALKGPVATPSIAPIFTGLWSGGPT